MHLTTRTRRSPSWIGALTLSLAAVLIVAFVAPGAAPVGAEPSGTLRFTEPNGSADLAGEADDFFTQVLGDPADFETPGDVTWPDGWRSETMSGGVWSGTSARGDANFFLLVPGFNIAASGATTRSGQVFPIDPNRYSRLVFKYTASAPTGAVVYWMSAGDPYGRNIGNSDIHGLAAGTHVVEIDLARRGGNGGGGALWTSERWGGLRFSPAFGTPGVSVQLDWVRLVPASGGPTVRAAWSCSSCSGAIDIFADLDNNPGNGGLVHLAGGVSSTGGQHAVPVGKLAPGNYFLAAKSASIPQTYSPGTFTVQAAPLFEITAPSRTSGADYATTVLGRPWAMNSASEIAAVQNIADLSVSGGVLQGRATSDDPQIYLLNGNGPPIDTTRFKYLSFSFFVPRPGNSPFDMARVLWYDRPELANVTGDIINWNNYWHDVSLDLTRVNMASSPEGWTGSQSVLRIDPHEQNPCCALPAYFRLGAVRLTADPAVGQGGVTPIRWRMLRGSGQVTLSYRPAGSTGGWTQLAAGVPAANGGYDWSAAVAPGRYEIRAVVSDGYSSAERWSNAALVVTSGALFGDVNPGEYFYQAVQYLTGRGVISGYADNSFRPFNNTTRSQTAKIIILGLQLPVANPATPTFHDVPRSDPFYQYVEAAVARGIISGYADRSFRPYNNVTRGQLSKMIVVAKGWALANPATATFRDVPRSDPFYQYVESAYRAGIISGYSDGTFRPGNNAVRGQLSKIVYEALVRAAEAQAEGEQPAGGDQPSKEGEEPSDGEETGKVKDQAP